MGQTREQVMTSEVDQQSGPPRDLTMGRRGMAASVNQLVSQTATDVLRRGGNAVDAAIAGAAMLMLVEPRNGHLGGDTFMLLHDAAHDRVVALNGSGAAPARATLEHYREIGRSAHLHGAGHTGVLGSRERAFRHVAIRGAP